MLRNLGLKVFALNFFNAVKLRIMVFLLPTKYLKYAKTIQVFENLRNDLVISEEWSNSVKLIRNGKYWEGVGKQKEILGNLHSSKESITNHNNVAVFYSYRWGTNFGHFGALGMKLRFDEIALGYVPKRKMYVKNKFLFDKFKLTLNDRIIPICNTALLQFERPSNWLEFELINLVRFGHGYIDHNSMHEIVFQSDAIDRENAPLKDFMPHDKLLKLLGLKSNDWFVALHIRNNKFLYDERKVNQHKFNPAIQAIIDAGGHVIQFGMNMKKVQGFNPDRVKLLSEIQGAENLDVSVIAKARFCLASASGPTDVAEAFGIPTLQTDSISCCLQIKSSSKGSMYLPKRVLRKNRTLKLSELAETGLGYREVSLKEWSKESITLQENSSTEILNATLEMLYPEKLTSELSSKLQEIRVEHNILARGKISESYLASNDWMLT